jgi:hypothetical protein
MTLEDVTRGFVALTTHSLMVSFLPQVSTSLTHEIVVIGTPCDADGYDLEPGTPPKTLPKVTPPSWSPFCSQTQFEAANFLFKKAELSQGNVDILMELWASTAEDGQAPFRNH